LKEVELQAPTGLEVSGNNDASDLTPTLSWDAAQGADTYEVNIAPAGGSIIYTEEGISGTSHEVPSGELEPGTDYVWDVTSERGDDEETSSNDSFTTPSVERDAAESFVFPLGEGAVPTDANDGDGWYDAQDFGVFNENEQKYHLGEDWNGEGGGDTDLGEPVVSAGIGDIVYADQAEGWGNVVIVRHTLPDGSEVESLYGHLESISRTKGTITKGEQVGTIGTGGDQYPAHLHLEIRMPESSHWGQPGPGYSNTSQPNGWLEPTEFIAKHHDSA